MESFQLSSMSMMVAMGIFTYALFFNIKIFNSVYHVLDALLGASETLTILILITT